MKSLFVVIGLILASSAAQPVLAGPNVNPNHIMWILDQASFDLLATNDFLKNKFSSFNKETTHSGSDTWTAVYLTGEKTHIEFMSPNPAFPEGTIGLALSVEEKVGDIDAIESQLRAEWGPAVSRAQRTLPWKGTIIPWFDFAILRLAGGNFRTWVMEFDSKFLERTRPKHPEDWGITRQSYNRPTYMPSRLLKNVTSVRLKLDPILLAQEKKTLLALDYKEAANGSSTTLSRPDFAVTLDQGDAGKFEISEIEMELNQVYSDQPEISLTAETKLIFDQKLPRAVLKRSTSQTGSNQKLHTSSQIDFQCIRDQREANIFCMNWACLQLQSEREDPDFACDPEMGALETYTRMCIVGSMRACESPTR